MNKWYLGDGVYVESDGHDLVLTSENGIDVLDRIVLDDSTYEALLHYVAELTRQRKQQRLEMNDE